jgi:hypothetical protein
MVKRGIQMSTIVKDDMALIITPNFEDGKWNGAVDLKAMVMPLEKLTEDNASELMYLVNGLIACFHLLNSDEKFAERVNSEIEMMHRQGTLTMDIHEPEHDNVVSIETWTRTRGNA